ncbi:hypothetical protein PCASD_23274 [Puccinia coronata f. sp. avenae]|uniref:Uncharacterized protein n=1 Tax=Puccinia coronata f. sp. avenae TaxID=200324 RepID=A0A2N5RYR4_9BASI|nr:hypothetical protein PCASD_23274 [Puccinia coronata f. sp. avenae]
MEGSTQTTTWHAKDTALHQAVVSAKLQALHQKTQAFTSSSRVREDRRTDPLYVHQLRTLLLPTLEENIDRLSDIVFGNSHRTEEPNQLFQAVLGALLEAEKTIHELENFNCSLWRYGAPQPNVQDLSFYRGGLTQEEIVSLWNDLQALFSVYLESLPSCGVFSQIDAMMVDPLIFHSLQSATRSTKEKIKTLVQWLALPDFKILQRSWQPLVLQSSQALHDLTMSRNRYRDRPKLHESLSDAIKVVKLMRIFMNKLTKPNNQELSRMPPNEHAALLQATAPISEGLRSLLWHLDDYVRVPDEFRDKPADPIADSLNNTFWILHDYFDLQQGAVRAFYHDFRYQFSLWNQLFHYSVHRLHATHQTALFEFTARIHMNPTE